jgi:alkylation response protein AidB-like acyl-CoA dehydrogenase
VFARTGPTALSIRAVLLRCPTPGYSGRALDMIGLRGARIGELSFDAVHVPRDQVLGNHLPTSQRGIWGAGRAFNAMRVQIAAQALGLAFAVRDYVCEQRPGWSGHELVSARLEAARALLYDVAVAVDHAPNDPRPPSIAKLHTTDLAVQLTRWGEYALGPGSLLEHPLLEKWCRDVCAFEFMDGTGNILRLNIAPNAAPVQEGP